MKFEQDILKAQIASQLSQEASIEGTDINILIKSFEENLIGSYDRDMFIKSWSSDLAKRFPSGGWRTINGASVFINNGKVVAGLGGFNGMIDDYFSAKKEEGNKMDAARKGQANKALNKVYRFEDGEMSYKQRVDDGIITDVKQVGNKFEAIEKDKTFREVPKAVYDHFHSNESKEKRQQKESDKKNLEEYKKEKSIEKDIKVEVPEKVLNKDIESLKKEGGEITTEKVEELIDGNFYYHQDKLTEEISDKQYDKYVEAYKKILTDKMNQPKEEEKKDDKPKKEEKSKLSPRAKQVLKDSQKTFDQSSSLRQIELYDLVKKNIGIDKNGKEKIGMGLDEDMVAAGNEFLKKNEKAYNEAKDLIQSRKDFKKEESKQKAIKDVSNIEKLALQQNKEMEDKIKSVSSSASVKEKLGVIKQFADKVKSIKDKPIYNKKKKN